MGYKHLTVGDLHLYDREMRTTKKMVENSTVILDELYKYLVENEDIILLNINGDIQHKTPNNINNRSEVAKWRELFRKIGILMAERFKKFKGYSITGVSDDVKKKLKSGEIYPIFTTKGNHDMDKEGIHTFYDDLLVEGLIVQATGLLVSTGTNRTYFSYRDYGIQERKLPKFKNKTDIIALEHNDILHAESLLWNVPNAKEKFITADEASMGADVTILHHIHEPTDPLYVGDKGDRVFWQVGSMGRTSYDDSHKRDIGYGALLEFGNVEDLYTVEFDLVPYKEYFSYKKIVRQQKVDEDYKDFSLKVEEHVIAATNYVEEIQSLEGIEEEVKEYAIEVMQKIESLGDE